MTSLHYQNIFAIVKRQIKSTVSKEFKFGHF